MRPGETVTLSLDVFTTRRKAEITWVEACWLPRSELLGDDCAEERL